MVVLLVHYVLDSRNKFYVACHEMDSVVIAYNDDVHSDNGKTGIKARCVDCNIPHDDIAKYALTEAKMIF
ncbi:NapC/NirT family cytochrome c [Campylobacter concisus]